MDMGVASFEWILFCPFLYAKMRNKGNSKVKTAHVAKSGHENVSGIPARTLLPVGIHYVVREFFAVVKMKLVPVR